MEEYVTQGAMMSKTFEDKGYPLALVKEAFDNNLNPRIWKIKLRKIATVSQIPIPMQ